MARFKDAIGREWAIGFTLGNLPKLREAGFNVSTTVRDAKGFEALEDPDTLGRVLWVLCGSQAEKAGTTQEQFAEGFDGPTICAAVEAIGAALMDFYLRPTVAAAVNAKLAGVTQEKERQTAQEIERYTTAQILNGWKSGVGSSPAPSELTPAG